ncbi:MAG: tetratricopeptide repeat protein [bacterium]|nr:tetratricopeptide repeat protein [bacterium]
MFNDLFKSNEERAREEAFKHFQLGMTHLEGKFFNRAMIEFKKAMDLAHEEVYPRLMQELDAASSGGQLEAALSIGLNLLKENQQDFELANKLGNYARELGNYNQAESLYKMALRINRKFERAFYNLAACGARVEVYDDQVKSAVSVFEKISDYVLPDYMGENPDPAGHIAGYLGEKLAAAKAQKIEDLQKQIAHHQEVGNSIEAESVQMDLDHTMALPVRVGPKEVIDEFKRLIDEDAEHAKTHRYNLGLYALSVNMPHEAQEAFAALPPAEFDLLDLLQAIALDQSGKLDEAIDRVTRILGANEFNRYSNVNLGLMFKKAGKHFLSTKYLVKTAHLLEKSGGIYSMRELVRIAYASLEEGNLKKARNYLEIAVTEMPDAKMWNTLGRIYVELKKYDEATEAYRKVLKLEPDNEEAQAKLREIHDYYADKGRSLETERKLKPAAEYYHKALGVLRDPDTLKSAASVYKSLGNMDKADELILELHAMEQQEKDLKAEENRQEKIKTAKAAIQGRKYREAMENLEAAFRMKVDKNVYLQLSALYKALKKFTEMEDLTHRWQKMLEHEEKMKLYEREKERALSGE